MNNNTGGSPDSVIKEKISMMFNYYTTKVIIYN